MRLSPLFFLKNTYSRKALYHRLLQSTDINRFADYPKNSRKILDNQKIVVPLQRFRRERALSSAGSERLPYKQRVGGSNPSAPTLKNTNLDGQNRLNGIAR